MPSLLFSIVFTSCRIILMPCNTFRWPWSFISLLNHQDICVLQKLKKKAKEIAAKAPQVTSLWRKIKNLQISNQNPKYCFVMIFLLLNKIRGFWSWLGIRNLKYLVKSISTRNENQFSLSRFHKWWHIDIEYFITFSEKYKSGRRLTELRFKKWTSLVVKP